jgi:hypothetical protein
MHAGGAADFSDLMWDPSEHAFLTGILDGSSAGYAGHAPDQTLSAWGPPAQATPPRGTGFGAQGDFQAMTALRRAESREGSTFWSLLDAPLDVAARDV